MIILILVIVGALGDFIRTQIYPIYAAASVAELGIFKRVDALFLLSGRHVCLLRFP